MINLILYEKLKKIYKLPTKYFKLKTKLKLFFNIGYNKTTLANSIKIKLLYFWRIHKKHMNKTNMF